VDQPWPVDGQKCPAAVPIVLSLDQHVLVVWLLYCIFVLLSFCKDRDGLDDGHHSVASCL